MERFCIVSYFYIVYNFNYSFFREILEDPNPKSNLQKSNRAPKPAPFSNLFQQAVFSSLLLDLFQRGLLLKHNMLKVRKFRMC